MIKYNWLKTQTFCITLPTLFCFVFLSFLLPSIHLYPSIYLFIHYLLFIYWFIDLFITYLFIYILFIYMLFIVGFVFLLLYICYILCCLYTSISEICCIHWPQPQEYVRPSRPRARLLSTVRLSSLPYSASTSRQVCWSLFMEAARGVLGQELLRCHFLCIKGLNTRGIDSWAVQ